jgi:hypothetical protein
LAGSPPLLLLTRAPDLDAQARVRRWIGAAHATGLRASRGQLGPRGPQAVLASLVRGLEVIGAPFALNPRTVRSAGTVGVLSDLEALRRAIAWRRDGTAARLIAGPNLVVLPSDAPELMTAPEVDQILVPSEWVRELYEADSPQLTGRVSVWPAGVDATRWQPHAVAAAGAGERRALLYRKVVNGQEEELDGALAAADAILRGAGFSTTTLTYGAFSPRQYRRALRATDVLVFFSPTESQGLALAEAWAADVPTLVWDRGRLEYRGRVYVSSSAPYLSAATGRPFADAPQLAELVGRWDALRAELEPRAWVLAHMTDEVCARGYLRLAASA